MSEFKIEKNVPLPRSRSKYPWTEMEVGDSFFVPGRDGDAVIGCFGKQAKDWGWKFSARTRHEQGIFGVRVWRIK